MTAATPLRWSQTDVERELATRHLAAFVKQAWAVIVGR